MRRTSDAATVRGRLNFVNAVVEVFGFLEEMGFSVVETLPTLVRYRKDHLQVSVYHGRQSYEVGLEISRNGARFSIGEIVTFSDSKGKEQYHNAIATTKQAVSTSLGRLAGLVKEFAGPALEGDAHFFDDVEKRRELLKHEFALDVLAEQLRPRANEAFRQGRYKEAGELYEKIQARLSPVERKKMAFAKAKDISNSRK